MTIEYLTNRDAVSDILETDQVDQLGMAMQWAHDTNAPELDDLRIALFDNAQRGGNCNADSCDVRRTTLIILDAWIAANKQEVAA